jgi:hypothetical protein
LLTGCYHGAMPDVIGCSFCGRTNHEAGKMLEKSDRQVANRWVRICIECARLAIEAIGQSEPDGNDHRTTRPDANILSRIDQFETLASELIAEPVYSDVGVLAEELHELLVNMRARVEQHLDEAI